MTTVPMDIVSDIFLRLPVKSLVRFRVISKACCRLIDSPHFIASHLDFVLLTGEYRNLLMCAPHDQLYTVDLNALNTASGFENPINRSTVFDSCNGLIGLLKYPTDSAIFNPSTRQIHRLPASPIVLPDLDGSSACRWDLFFGLGYDSVNDDYKVVRMVHCGDGSLADRYLGRDYPYEVKVFSLKRNSWKRIDCFFPQVSFACDFDQLNRHGYGVHSCNSLHWLFPRRPGLIGVDSIVRFDLALEEFGVIHFPEAVANRDVDIKMDICVLDGYLSLICNYRDLEHVDVWMMKEYNVKGSWTKAFTVQKPDEETIEFLFVKPLVYSKDRGKVLLEIDHEELAWFDLETKKLTILTIKHCPYMFAADVIVSSLVLGCKGDFDNIKAQERRAS